MFVCSVWGLQLQVCVCVCVEGRGWHLVLWSFMTSHKHTHAAACSNVICLPWCFWPVCVSTSPVFTHQHPPPPTPPCTFLPAYAPLCVCRERHRCQWQQVRPSNTSCLRSSQCRLYHVGVISLPTSNDPPFFSLSISCHATEFLPLPPSASLLHLPWYRLLLPLRLPMVMNVATPARIWMWILCLELVSVTIRTQPNSTVCRQMF